MKKLLLLFVTTLVLSSCSKKDDDNLPPVDPINKKETFHDIRVEIYTGMEEVDVNYTSGLDENNEIIRIKKTVVDDDDEETALVFKIEKYSSKVNFNFQAKIDADADALIGKLYVDGVLKETIESPFQYGEDEISLNYHLISY